MHYCLVIDQKQEQESGFDDNTLKTDSNSVSVVRATIYDPHDNNAKVCDNDVSKIPKDDIKSRLFYLKLSMDINRAISPVNGERHCKADPSTIDDKGSYTCAILDFYAKEKNKEINDRFPHDSTPDVFYDSLQFRAYRDLGYILAKKQLLPVLPPIQSGEK